MKLAVNGRFLINRVTGVERYARSVLREMIPLAIERGHELSLITPGCSDADAHTFACAIRQTGHAGLSKSGAGRHLWEQFVLPFAARQLGADLLINLTNTAPVWFAPNVVTLHDVAWMANPEWFSRSFLFGYRLFVEPAARKAQRIVTVSKFSSDEICRRLRIPAERITVIPNGNDANVFSKDSANQRVDLDECGVKEPYFLHVASADPRKNLQVVVEAAAELSQEMAPAPEVVSVGGGGSQFAVAANRGAASTVRFLGYVDDASLRALYKNALAVVSASVYEGFGLPVLEAMASGTPVIASNIPAHQELTGAGAAESCALLFDPNSARELADAMRRIYEDAALRRDLSNKGLIRATEYSWSQHAERLLDVVESAGAKQR